MPLALPPPCWHGYQSNLTAPAGTPGTVITADAVSHTKGLYTELITSTNFDAYWFQIVGSGVSTSATATSLLCDIAIGAAGAETVIIPNLNFGGAWTIGNGPNTGGQKYEFPLYIPSGSRISARCQSLISADTVNIIMSILGQPSQPVWAGSLVTDYGTTLASSLGTSVALGRSAAEGSYTQIVASTTQPVNYLAVGVGLAADTTITGDVCFLDVGVGAATESTVLTDGRYTTSNAEQIAYLREIGGYVSAPAASRLAVRISGHNSGAESHDVILYGVS